MNVCVCVCDRPSELRWAWLVYGVAMCPLPGSPGYPLRPQSSINDAEVGGERRRLWVRPRCAGRAGTGFRPPELGSRAPTTSPRRPGAHVEVAGPGDSQGLALLLEKPLAFRCSLVASAGVWACCMCIFSIPKPAGGASSRNTAPNTLIRENTSLKTKTKTKKTFDLSGCLLLLGWLSSRPAAMGSQQTWTLLRPWQGVHTRALERCFFEST